jgi:hypothetical protein
MASWQRWITTAVYWIAGAPVVFTPLLQAQAKTSAPEHSGAAVLRAADYQHYIDLFRQQEKEATGKLYEGEIAEDSWAWMQREVPWFDASDKNFEEMYYFRWYAWKKHLVKSPQGYLITEWLPKPEVTDYGVLPDAAPFHIAEARWLHNPAIAEDYARYWFSPGADSHKYSDALAATVRDLTLVNGDRKFGTSLLPALKANYKAWEDTQQDSNGLFWSIDTRDAMEKSISGDGYRPTLNSYIYGDARAIAELAAKAGDSQTSAEFNRKADTLHALIESRLWNPKDQFYEVVSPAVDSWIRRQKKFIDPGTTLQLSRVRELIGYIPWQFDIPAASHDVAWKQLFDSQGFDGKFGATTAERRSPRFRFASDDQCTWNGPAWPYAMTQTLLALAAYENHPSPMMTQADYLKLFSRYVLAQHLTLKSGNVVDWIDEDYDADTDEWIAKGMLIAKNKQIGRGNYYNHSGFADPLITGLIGLRPRSDDRISIHPLLPAGTWTYFALDALPYHGHQLTILWDASGTRYHHGKGLTLLIDGKQVANRSDLGPLEYELR